MFLISLTDVARLYDRLLAHGSRPLSGYDLMRAAAKVRGGDFEATLRSSSIEALQKQGGVPLTDKHIEGKTAQTRSAMRAHVSADSVPTGFSALEKCQLVIGDEIGWYFDAQEGRMSDMLVAPAVPPFRQTFVDFRGVPNIIGAVEWGVHLSTVDLDDDIVSPAERRGSLLSGGTAPPDEARWVVIASVYASWDGRDVVGPVGTAQLYLDPEGSVYRHSLAEPIVVDGHSFHDLVVMDWLTGGDSKFAQQLVTGFHENLLMALQDFCMRPS